MTKGTRRLGNDDCELKAETFARLVSRNGRAHDWPDYFEWWAGPECKDFEDGDRALIRSIVEELMVAGGVSVFSDPFDYLRVRAPEES